MFDLEREKKIRIEKSGKVLDSTQALPWAYLSGYYSMVDDPHLNVFFGCWGREGRVPYQRLSPSFFLIPSPITLVMMINPPSPLPPRAAMSTKTHIEMYISNSVNQNRPTEGGNKAKEKQAECDGKIFFLFFKWWFQNMTAGLFSGQSEEVEKKKKTLEDTYLV